MGKIHAAGDIQLSDDYRFTKKSWIAERAGWGFLIAIIVAAILGLLGPGLISARTVVGPSGTLAVEYDRFGQFKTEETFRIRLTSRPEDPARVSFWIDQTFLDDVSIEDIQPHPLEVRPEGDRTTYIFAAPERHTTVDVRLEIAPQQAGRLAGRFGQARDSGVDVAQIVYP
jgi:hypothetical protein